MQTALWILSGGASGAVCGCGALHWSHRLLRTRGWRDTLPRFAQYVLILAAAVCGGTIGFCTGEWLPMALSLAVFTVGITVSVSDWLCRLIPNPTVLSLFALKMILIAASLLKLPGAPTFSLLASLGGMVFCFLLFSLPGLTGKQVGAGDIKLAAAIGFLLEFQGALLAIVGMGILVLGYCAMQRKMPLLTFLKTDIPMGPFIMGGTIFACTLPYLTL